MGMGERMATPTDADILTLTQWFSPAFPVGAFAYSHGLEWAIDIGDVTNVDETEQWITDVLRHGGGWNDCLFLIEAYRSESAGDVACVDQMCRAFAASSERLKETVLQGQAFCEIFGSVWGEQLEGFTYSVAIGRAARLRKLPLKLTLQMYLQAFSSNLVAVAMRLVPLGQTDGHRLIRDFTSICTELSEEVISMGIDDLSSTSFIADIASMKHETQYSRIFRT